MTPTNLRAHIIGNPQSVTDLFLDGHEAALWEWLTPSPETGFASGQRALLRDLWLLSDTETVAAANAIMALLNRQVFAPVTTAGEVMIPVDLVTDCLPPGSTWNAIAHILVTRLIVLRLTEDFPAPEVPDA